MGEDERMERLLEKEEGVVWPEPRDDPEQEISHRGAEGEEPRRADEDDEAS